MEEIPQKKQKNPGLSTGATDPKPNPGSPEAIELGCTCPEMDNNYGAGRDDGRFIMAMDCKVHNDFYKENRPMPE